MKRNYTFLRTVLAAICAGHFLTGLLLISGRPGIRLGSRLYGASFEPTGQFRHIIRPAGAYVLAMAWLQAMAVRNPQRYKGVIDVTLFIYWMRLFQRVFFRQDVYEAFGIAPKRHWLTTAFFQLMAALLLIGRLGLRDE